MKTVEIEIGGNIAEQPTEQAPLLAPVQVTALKEFKRGCGYRKAGGTYMVNLAEATLPSDGFPKELSICPCCKAGIKFTRGFTWIQPRLLFGDESLPETAGLIWIGGKFYPTPKAFINEAAVLGISRRIATVPRGLVMGETRIYLAHLKAIDCGEGEFKRGVFSWFVPTKLQYVVREDDTNEKLHGIQERGIEPISVTPADEMFADD